MMDEKRNVEDDFSLCVAAINPSLIWDLESEHECFLKLKKCRNSQITELQLTVGKCDKIHLKLYLDEHSLKGYMR